MIGIVMGLLRSLARVRWLRVWQRNMRVWCKLVGPALLGNVGEPLLYLFAFGYGLGSLVGDVGGLNYITFLASGFICASVMNTASFEGTYSAYTRMAVQETWTAMLHTPLNIYDILWGEVFWGATKSLLTATSILLVATLMGAISDVRALLALPVAALLGASFTAMALVVTAFARNYDFFLYYFTLLLTPLLLLSGVFFPLEGVPDAIRIVAEALPLHHAIQVVRPLATGGTPTMIVFHLAVIAIYGLVAISIAAALINRIMHR